MNCNILLNTGDNLLLNDGYQVLLNSVCADEPSVVFQGAGNRRYRQQPQQIIKVYAKLRVKSGLLAHLETRMRVKSSLMTKISHQIDIKSKLLTKVETVINLKSSLNAKIQSKIALKGVQSHQKFYELIKILQELD